MEPDGSILFETKIDDGGMDLEQRKLANTLKKTNDQVKAQKELVSSLQREYAALQDQIAEGKAKGKATGGSEEAATLLKRQIDAEALKLEGLGVKADETAEKLKKAFDDKRPKWYASATDRAARSTNNFARRLRGIILSAAVFSVLYKALNALKSYMSDALKTFPDLKKALAEAKGAWMTAFQPIVSYVVPILTSFAQILTKTALYVAKFTAAIFGTTTEKAAKAAENLYNEANAIESVGSSAEDAQKSLAGFDQIQTIGSDTATGKNVIGATFDFAMDDIELPKWMAGLYDWVEGLGKLDKKGFGDNIKAFVKGFWEVIKSVGMAVVQGFLDALGWLISTVAKANPRDMEAVGAAIASIVTALVVGKLVMISAAYIAGVTGAIKGLVTFCVAHPVAAVGLAVAGLCTALIAYGNYKFNDSELGAYLDWLKGVTAKAKKAADDTRDLLDALKLKEEDIENEYGGITKLAEEYFKLADANELDPEQQTLLKAYAKELVEKVPKLKTYIDVVTGAYTGQKDEIFKVIEATKQLYLVQAAKDSLTGIATQMFVNKQALDEARKALQSSYSRQAELYDQLANMSNIDRLMGGKGLFISEELSKLEQEIKKDEENYNDLLSEQSKLNEQWQYSSDYIAKYGQTVEDTAGESAKTLKEKFTDAFESIQESAEKTAKTIAEALLTNFKNSPLGGLVVEAYQSRPPLTALPGLATGTVIPRSREFAAILGDNKVETEVVSPLSTIKQALKDAAAEIGFSGAGGNMTVIMQIDKREFGRAVYKLGNSETQRVGVKLSTGGAL